jgi:hypothetical protein
MPDIFINMIKQTWNISSEEKYRILKLHESATKNLYLIGEQEIDAQDNANIIRNNDKNDKFYYFAFQPQTSRMRVPIDWEKEYVVVADDETNAYVAQVQEKDSNGKPIKFKIEFNRPLVRWNPMNLNQNEFKFSMVKTDNNQREWNMDYDEKTKNSLVSKDALASYYAVLYGDKIIIAPVTTEGPFNTWGFDYQQEGVIEYNSIQKNSEVEFVPRYNVIIGSSRGRNAYTGLAVATTFGFYPVGKGSEPKIPPPNKIPNPTPPPPPSNFGDNFGDNISFPNASTTEKPEYQAFVKFINGNDISNYKFIIQASASKCRAKSIEGQGVTQWKDDKTTYPDVVVDKNADMSDIGNLNLTKARAQHLKDFLIKNIPKLKDANFEVIAQGSIGTCGSEEENRAQRVVSLSVQKLK